MSVAVLSVVVGQWRAASPLTLRGRATVQADMVDVSPRVAGFIAEVMVGDNARVRAGDPLVRIDAREFKSQVDLARARVAAAEADLAYARARQSVQGEALVVSDAEVALAEAALVFDEADARRYATLAARRSGPRQQGESSATTARSSAAARDAAWAGVAEEREGIGVVDTEIQRAEAALTTARAVLPRVEFDLTSILVRAPSDGVVTDRQARVGAYAPVGRQLLTLVPIEGAYVVARIPEGLLGQIASGMEVLVSVRAHPDLALRGRVTGIGPGSYTTYSLLPFDNDTSSFHAPPQRIPVKIVIEGEVAVLRELLAVRMTVDLTFPTSVGFPGADPRRSGVFDDGLVVP